MRILQICSKPPFPAVDGGCVTSVSLANSLIEKGHSLKVFCLATYKHPFLPDRMPENFLHQSDLECVTIDSRVKLIPALLSLFEKESYNLYRFFSPEADQTLIRIVTEENFDCIILDGLYTSVYLQGLQYYSTAKIILRQHNIEWKVWKTLADKESNPFKRYYYKLASQKIEKHEKAVLQEVDAVIGISEEETNTLQDCTNKPCIWIPAGMKTGKGWPNYSNLDCQFVGSMDWTPNKEGVIWFLEEVWPKVNQLVPGSNFHLAGRSMPPPIQSKNLPGFVKLGFLESLDEFWKISGVLVAPLLSGGGLKIKIIEAMVNGLAVLTTSHGAEGLPGIPGHHYLVAKNADEFITHLSQVLVNPEYKQILGERAKELANACFGETFIADKWDHTLQTILSNP